MKVFKDFERLTKTYGDLRRLTKTYEDFQKLEDFQRLSETLIFLQLEEDLKIKSTALTLQARLVKLVDGYD